MELMSKQPLYSVDRLQLEPGEASYSSFPEKIQQDNYAFDLNQYVTQSISDEITSKEVFNHPMQNEINGLCQPTGVNQVVYYSSLSKEKNDFLYNNSQKYLSVPQQVNNFDFGQQPPNQSSKVLNLNQTTSSSKIMKNQPSNKQQNLSLDIVMEIIDSLEEDICTPNNISQSSEHSKKNHIECFHNQPINNQAVSSDNLISFTFDLATAFEQSFINLEKTSQSLVGTSNGIKDPWNKSSNKYFVSKMKPEDKSESLFKPQNAFSNLHTTECLLTPSSDSTFLNHVSTQEQRTNPKDKNILLNGFFENEFFDAKREAESRQLTLKYQPHRDQNLSEIFDNTNDIDLNNKNFNHLTRKLPQNTSNIFSLSSEIKADLENERPSCKYITSCVKPDCKNISISERVELNRLRNNAACKRARQRRKKRKLEREALAIYLSKKNEELRNTIATLESENFQIKSYFSSI